MCLPIPPQVQFLCKMRLELTLLPEPGFESGASAIPPLAHIHTPRGALKVQWTFVQRRPKWNGDLEPTTHGL